MALRGFAEQVQVRGKCSTLGFQRDFSLAEGPPPQ
jgi:hypothetical protein